MADKLAFLAALDFVSWSPADVVRTLKSIGYHGVSWTMAHFNPRRMRLTQLQDLITQTKEGGLEVAEIVVQQDLVSLHPEVRQDRKELIKECIEAAGTLNVRNINLFTGPAPWDPHAPRLGRDIAEGEAWGQVISAFQELIPLAEKHKVFLAVEAVWGHLSHDYYTTRELFNSLPQSEFLAINFDPSHYFLYRNDILWAIKRWGCKIINVHMKDAVGRAGEIGYDFLFPLLGEGMIDWKAFLEALHEIGYEGFLTVEFEAFDYYRRILDGDPVQAAELSMLQLQHLLAL